MSKLTFYLLVFTLNIILSQIELFSNENQLRSLEGKEKPKKKGNVSPQQNSKLLQTLYSDSYSNNFYYTTLYITDKKIKQTYLIDTGSATMSSPCGPCEYCGKQKKNYFDPSNKKGNEALKCGSKICKMVPATNCKVKEKNIDKKACSFFSQKPNGDGLKGYYLSNIVYFEADKNLTSTNLKKIYRSYALPIGCTLGEFGKYKDMNVDGVIGLNNDKGSFTNVLYNLKIIKKNIFTLCFGLEGGYMSMGEIDTSYHQAKKINYVPFQNSTNYLIRVNGIQIGKNKRTKTNLFANIDTGSTFTYLPKNLYKSVFTEFEQLCTTKKGNNICGNFQVEADYGYCSAFKDRESLFKTINEKWPTIILELNKNIEYIWKPINYYYYYIKGDVRKACFGLLSHNSDSIILGTNFMHGHDIVFDKEGQSLGFVPADCSRRNIMWNRMAGNLPSANKTKSDPVSIDKEIHKNEKEKKFNLGDNNNKEGVEFIKGRNKELEILNDFKLIKFIIILISVLVIVIILLVVIILLILRKREYQHYSNITNDENNKLNTPQINIEEPVETKNIIDEPKVTNDLNNNVELYDTKDNSKVTTDEVQFLKNIMKNTNK